MSSSIPSWQLSTAHAQPFRGARDLAFCLNVPLDLLLVWASSEGSGETARMRRLAWTFAARIGDKYQIRLTRSILSYLLGGIFLLGSHGSLQGHEFILEFVKQEFLLRVEGAATAERGARIWGMDNLGRTFTLWKNSFVTIVKSLTKKIWFGLTVIYFLTKSILKIHVHGLWMTTC